MPSYSERITLLRDKETLAKQRHLFSCRSFFYGFICATFISYFIVCHFVTKTGQTVHDPVVSRSATLRRSNNIHRPVLTKSNGFDTGRLNIEFAVESINISATSENIHLSKSLPTAVPEQSSIVKLAEDAALLVTAANSKIDSLSNAITFEATIGNFTSKNLILGIAVNTNPRNFAIFCGSFRLHAQQGEAVVFVNSPVSSRIRQIAVAHQVRIIEFDINTLEPEYMRKYHPSSVRWVLFDRFLSSNGGAMRKWFEKVILVDIRDTMFQSDPFQLIKTINKEFYVFGETPGVNIDSCGWNSGWVKDCFGENMLTMVRNSPILCSGVSMGSMDQVAEYLSKMSAVLLGLSDLGKYFPKCERNGVDQGVHNVLIHMGLMSTASVQYEHEFPVINLQAYPNRMVSASDSSLLLNERGKPYVLVHQYDRLSVLQLSLAEKYVDWVDMRDPKAEWTAESACAGYSVAYDKDYFRGRCELGSERLMSAASCCQSCLNKNIQQAANGANNGQGNSGDSTNENSASTDYSPDTKCTSFTFLNGVCYMKKCRMPEVKQALTDKNQNYYDEKGATSAYVRFSTISSS